jgi:hypothetical protein
MLPSCVRPHSGSTGKVLADLPIGAGCDSPRFDNGYAFASCCDDTLAVAKKTSPGKFEIVQDVVTVRGAMTVDVDPTTHKIPLPTAEFSGGIMGRPNAEPDTFMINVVEPSGGEAGPGHRSSFWLNRPGVANLRA